MTIQSEAQALYQRLKSAGVVQFESPKGRPLLSPVPAHELLIEWVFSSDCVKEKIVELSRG